MGEVTPQLESLFEAAVNHVNENTYSKACSLQFYGLYKHITVGKCDASQKPGRMQFKAQTRYEAWKACETLSVVEAIKKYIKLLSETDPKFKVEDIKELSEAEAQAVAELRYAFTLLIILFSTLPPPIKPKVVNGKYFRAKAKSNTSPNLMLEIMKQSGFDPEKDGYDDEDRIELHEKLVKYYRAVDPNRLVKGIGEIVDFGLTVGPERLNQKLKAEYNIDLEELEARDRRRKSSLRPVAKRPPPATIFKNADLKTLTPEDAALLAATIEKFFGIFDPEKVKRGIDNGFIELILYIDRRGEDALNRKLTKKYGKCLTDVDVDEAPHNEFDTSNTQLKEVGMANLTTKSSMMLVKGPTNEDSFQGLSQTQLHQIRTESKENNRSRSKSEDVAMRNVNKIELPPYIKPALVNYYMRYEPSKLKNGSVKKVYGWAKRNGLRKLNKELKRRYNQSLDDFIDDSDKLKAELVAFYKQIDENKIKDGLEKIHSWGIKNGRTALNQKFKKKYGFDLDTYKEAALSNIVAGVSNDTDVV